MIGFKYSYPPINFTNNWQSRLSTKKRYIYWLCTFAILMAVLKLGQDYISSVLNSNQFHILESLSFKLFWLLFIPLVLIMELSLEKVRFSFSKVKYLAFNIFLVTVITLAHLLIFSLFLFAVSQFIHQNPWELSYLITEKLSTRLYIGLSIYIVFSVYFLLRQKALSKQENKKKYSKAVAVKNGKKTIFVDVDSIKWIGSDGPYLYIHTEDKKHIKLDSLKNIITTLPENFKRIHRSTIVNTSKVDKLVSRGNGDYDVIIDDSKLRLSRNYSKSLKGILL